jgi:hypothetical protein
LPQVAPFLSTICTTHQLLDSEIDLLPKVIGASEPLKEAVLLAQEIGQEYVRQYPVGNSRKTRPWVDNIATSASLCNPTTPVIISVPAKAPKQQTASRNGKSKVVSERSKGEGSKTRTVRNSKP